MQTKTKASQNPPMKPPMTATGFADDDDLIKMLADDLVSMDQKQIQQLQKYLQGE